MSERSEVHVLRFFDARNQQLTGAVRLASSIAMPRPTDHAAPPPACRRSRRKRRSLGIAFMAWTIA